jgi:hypothetical protein
MEADPRQWLGHERILKASKDSVFSLTPNGDELSFCSLTLDSVIPKTLVKSEQKSLYFVASKGDGEAPLHCKLPVIASFKTIDNVVVVASKQTPNGTYMWGVPVDTLVAWKPPSKATDMMCEDGVLSLFKLPHADLEGFSGVENTATHRLREMLDKFISHSPTFKAAKIKSVADMRKYADLGYEASIKASIIAGEDLERKAAKAKGASSRDNNESHGGGDEARQKWALLKTALLETHVGNLKLPFAQRYIELRIDEHCKATPAVVAELKTKLR